MATGRYHAQDRLKELSNDPNLGGATRSWLKQEMNRLERAKENKSITLTDGRVVTRTKGRTTITNPDGTTTRRSDKTLHNPPGYEMAHIRGFEAEKGHSYFHANFKTIADHRRQTRIDHEYRDDGKKNLTPAAVAAFNGGKRGNLSIRAYELQKREVYRSSLNARSSSASSSAGGGAGGAGAPSLPQALAQNSQSFQQAHNIPYNQFESAPKPKP